jgi:AcrR family transcriptional regulator
MPKIVDHDLYREELLGKCMPIFVARGFDSASMREISRELNVSTGTLYHYFPTKEALFESMVRYFVEKDAKEITRLSEAGPQVFELINYVSAREAHFLNLILLAVDVKRHHSDSVELTALLDESWNSYRDGLSRFFPDDTSKKAGEAFLSFFVGALFLRSSRTEQTSWQDLFKGLGEFSIFFSPIK